MRGFMAPLATFTLESLVAARQWSAAQSNAMRKAEVAKANKKREASLHVDRKTKGSSE